MLPSISIDDNGLDADDDADDDKDDNDDNDDNDDADDDASLSADEIAPSTSPVVVVPPLTPAVKPPATATAAPALFAAVDDRSYNRRSSDSTKSCDDKRYFGSAANAALLKQKRKCRIEYMCARAEKR
jgi:hypothetical protein